MSLLEWAVLQTIGLEDGMNTIRAQKRQNISLNLYQTVVLSLFILFFKILLLLGIVIAAQKQG